MSFISRCWKIRWAVVLCVVLAAAVIGMGVTWTVQQARSAQSTRDYLVDCTTPGPKTPTPEDPTTGHACYDQGNRRTGEAVQMLADLFRQSIDCEHFYEPGVEPKSACVEVNARLDAIARNENPFAPTTTIPGGNQP